MVFAKKPFYMNNIYANNVLLKKMAWKNINAILVTRKMNFKESRNSIQHSLLVFSIIIIIYDLSLCKPLKSFKFWRISFVIFQSMTVFFWVLHGAPASDCMNVLNAANVCLNGSWQSKQSAVCVRKEEFRPLAGSPTDRRTSCKCKVFRFKFIIKIEFCVAL